ncbi:hypothetical protein [Corynebacterium caspium]|uniref:hypothetical protein n=1 Tax=Corynebacterium caspium TaxID=234828 RepID=UPI0003758D4A|nr:hypothetical protein [Corynebacterium caspium]WKD59596.1 hypothetical protein CCASP_06055 [Corynebacterium caspium DSM 44850]
MRLDLPQTLEELAADSAIIRADQADRYRRRYGVIEAVEFIGPNPQDPTFDAPVQIRLLPSQIVLPGRRIAELSNTWSWRTASAPERPDDPINDTVLAAAGTLCQGAPIYLAPRADGSTYAVALPYENTLPTLMPRALVAGLADLSNPELSRRAVLAAASQWQIPISGDIDFANDIQVRFQGDIATEVLVSQQPSILEMATDFYYFSLEHELFAGLQKPEILLGTYDATTWYWENPEIMAYGREHAILPFAQPRRPVAEVLMLLTAAKPALGLWYHSFQPTKTGRQAVYLSSGPKLPPPSQAAIHAVLARPVPQGWDRDRAAVSYRQQRGASIVE